MKLVYATDPHATLLIVDDDKELNWTLKSIGVSSFGVANRIADAVANGVITIDELMPAGIATGSDAINFINNRNATNLGEEMSNEAEVCVWSDHDETGIDGTYKTACSETFDLGEDDSPLREWMRYCCYCGRPAEFWINGRRQ